MANEAKIAIKDLSLSENEKSTSAKLLDSISMIVRLGSIHILFGPSGSGKSTLLNCINRLREFQEGEIFLDNQNIKDINIFDLRRQVGLVKQKATFFDGSVKDNILYGPRLWKFTPLPDVVELLSWVGLHERFLDKDPLLLSGGEQQRISLARALANRPDVLLLDEPTSAIDQTSTLKLEELIAKLCSKKKLTVIWVTHDFDQAKRIGDDLTVLLNGKIERREFI